MEEFAANLADAWQRSTPDVVHSHFWMSGMASLQAANARIPVIQTFHALGSVKRRHQGKADTSPRERIYVERDILERATGVIATCTDEVHELQRLGAQRRAIEIVPCGVDLTEFRPDGPFEFRQPRPRHDHDAARRAQGRGRRDPRHRAAR
jgi:glycosyltransferase involved in cell wall biosynthesis